MATTFDQQKFRFREDNGNETGATWKAAANTNITQIVTSENANFRIRIGVRQTGTTSATLTGRLYIAKNGGSYAQASSTSTGGCKVVGSSNITDNEATTQQITSGGSGFVAGKMDDVNGQSTATATMAQNRDTEHEFMLQLDFANLADGDYFDFRLRNSTTALTTYTVTGRITVDKLSGLLKISQLGDNFNDNTDDSTNFSKYLAGTSTITETSKTQVHAPQASLASSGTACYQINWFDLASSCAFINVQQVLNANANNETYFHVGNDSNNRLLIRVSGASQVIQAFKIVYGTWTQVGSDITYNSTNMKWWRIRESGGTIYFEYSATGLDGSWNSIGSTAKPIVIAAVYAEWGTYSDNVATPGTAIFDNFNVSPAPVLSSPADTGSYNGLRPPMTFQGDDPSLADLEYQIQLNTSSTFNEKVAYDNSSTTGVRNTLGLPITLTHVVGEHDNRCLILATAVRGAVTVSNYPTYNGDNLTYLGSKQLGSDERVELWYLMNPDVGSHDLSVNFSGDQNIAVTVATYYNVGSIALGGNASGSAVTASSCANTNATTDVIVDIIGLQTGGANPSSTTLTRRQYGNNSNEGFGFGDTISPTANLTEVWTFTSNYYAELCAILSPSTLPLLDKISTTDAGFASGSSPALLFGPENFDGGSLPASFDSKETDTNGTVAIDTTSKVNGSNSVKVSRTGAGGTSLVKTLGSAVSELYIKMKLFIPTAFTFTGTYMGLIECQTTGATAIVWANIEDYGTLRLTLNGATMGWVDTGIDISKNVVHTLQIYFKISSTVGNWKVWLDSEVSGTPTAQGSGTLNTGTTNFQKIRSPDPYSDGAHGDYYFDDFAMDSSFISDTDTHPFTQNTDITYTPQSDLSVTTYYWRVRSLDINDANVWSDWSTVRSFSVTNDTVTPKTLLGLARIAGTTLKTLLGRARIQIATLQTLLGKSRIGIVTQKALLGLSRITAITSKTLLGKASILSTTLGTLLGRARIQIATLQALLGKSRILVATSKLLTGISRITATTQKALLGQARVLVTTLNTVLGKARVEIASLQTRLGQSRITVATLKTLAGISRVTATNFQALLGKARITATNLATLLGQSRIGVSTLKVIQGLSNIILETSQAIQGLANISTTTLTTNNILGKANILVVYIQSLLGKARIGISTLQNLLGTSRIESSTVKLLLGLSNITNIIQENLLGKARILIVSAKTLLGKSAVILLTARDILGQSRVAQIVQKSLFGISRVITTTLNNLQGRARLEVSTAMALFGKTRIGKTANQIILGVGDLISSTANDIFGNSRIIATFTRFVEGKANVLVVFWKSLFGRSRIEVSKTVVIYGKSRVTVTHHKPVVLETINLFTQLSIKKGISRLGSSKSTTTLKTRQSPTTI